MEFSATIFVGPRVFIAGAAGIVVADTCVSGERRCLER
jgi:hypothetical protein